MDAYQIDFENLIIQRDVVPTAYYINVYDDGPGITAANSQKACVVLRAAYDIGSISTKVVAGKINVCNMTIEEIISTNTYPVMYHQDLSQSSLNIFSDWIKSYGLQTLLTAKAQIEFDSHAHKNQLVQEIQHCGVATAAFRKADNGIAFVQELSNRLEMPVMLITQEEEGKLAYLSVLSQINNQELAPIVWDIGGGSMQLTFRDELGEFYVMGSDLASHTFEQLVLDKICHKNLSESPNPMSHKQIKEAMILARQNLVLNDVPHIMISERVSNGSSVIAIGSVHNQSILPIVSLAAQTQDNFYIKDSVLSAIELLANKTDEEILALKPNLDRQFVKTQLTNLILVYTMMDTFGIDKVRTMQASNTEGLLLSGCYFFGS